MELKLRRIGWPFLICVGSVALMMGGLLLGFEPVGGDPDRMYRPLKQELTRFISMGQLPWWSDRFGLGLPLLAESHVAALYPPNWLLYGLFDVSLAYRLAMWGHYVILAGATYGLARILEVAPWGAAIAGIAFTFCGFQAIHSSHEPFYHAIAYVPLILLCAEWFLASGRKLAILLVAILWAMQLTLGHFQLQWWTGCLLLFIGVWRVLFDGRPWHRAALLGIALVVAAAMASLQLAASWELARFVGTTNRSANDLAFFGFPPEHLVEAVIPGFVRGIPGGPEASYWYALGTTGYEACFWVGTVPLILFLLSLSRGISRPLAPWLVVIVVSLGLAILPRSWPTAQLLLMHLPGFGWFRAPGRYIALASLGICLLAGRGCDEVTAPGKLRLGWVLVIGLALAAFGWALYWSLRPSNAAVLGGTRLAIALGSAVVIWLLAIVLILAVRLGRVGLGWLTLMTMIEVGTLFFTSTTVWGWKIQLPRESRILARLSEEAAGGRVAGLIHNLPVRAGEAPIAPYTGFAPPPPHPFLDLGAAPGAAFAQGGRNRLQRYGTTHGIWDRPVTDPGVEVLLECEDPVLDRLVVKPAGSSPRATWRLVRYRESFPVARVATRNQYATTESSLLSSVSYDLDPETVWYLAGDRRARLASPQAQHARLLSFNGQTAEVEHDGSCDLVLNRTYYPGWFASVNGGVEHPVERAELGIQCVHLDGPGPSRVRLSYRPGFLAWARWLSGGAAITVLLPLLLESLRILWGLLRRR